MYNVNNKGNTALIYVCEYGIGDCIAPLIETEADVNKVHDNGEFALTCFASYNQPVSLKEHIQTKADI